MPAEKPVGPFMLASDDAERMFMFQFASSCAGFDTAVVMSAASEVLGYFSDPGSTKPSMLMIDLNLRGASAFGLLNWLHLHLPVVGFPIVVLSDNASPAMKKKALGLGAAECIAPPKGFFQTVELLERLKTQWAGTVNHARSSGSLAKVLSAQLSPEPAQEG